MKLNRSDAIALWKRGKEEWNEWVEANPEVDIDFSNVNFRQHTQGQNTLFEGYVFPVGMINFEGAQFTGSLTSFKNAKFRGGRISFDAITFQGNSFDFTGVEFDGNSVSFAKARLTSGNVYFNNVKFRTDTISFASTYFGMGRVEFVSSNFTGEDVSFIKAEFKTNTVNFTKATFSAEIINFNEAKFNGEYISFEETMFSGLMVSFNQADFMQGVTFENANFKVERLFFENIETKQAMTFLNSQFLNSVLVFSFRRSIFHKALIFPTQNYNCVIDLRNTKFNAQMMLHDIKCTLRTETNKWGVIPHKIACDPEDISRLRRLKEIAEGNRNHEGALAFHADEMRAKRWHVFGRFASILDLLFDKISNYGQSILDPFVLFIAVNALFTSIYFAISVVIASTLKVYFLGYKIELLFQALNTTFYNSIPFIPVTKTTGAKGIEALYGGQIPAWFGSLSTLQGLISIILLFLIGLGLRNRFRI